MAWVRAHLLRAFNYFMFYGAIVYATAPSLIRKIHGNDLWKALYSGRYLALFHQFPHHSTFTYSPVKDFLVRNAFNWLGNLTFLGWYLMGGNLGLQFFRLLMVLLVVGLYHSLVDYDRSPLLLLVLVVFVFGLTQKLILRTAIFSLPFTALLFWFWHQVDKNQRLNWLYAIPPLLLIWSNIHGSYILGWGLFGVLTVGKGLQELVPYFSSPGPKLFKRCLIVLIVTVPLVSAVKPFPETKLIDQFSGVFQRLTLSEPTSSSSSPTQTKSFANDSFLQTLKSYLKGGLFAQKTFRSAEFRLVFNWGNFAFVKANVLIFLLFLGTLLVTSSTSPTDWLLFVVGTFLGFSYLRTASYLPLITLPVVLPRLFSRNEDSWIRKSFPVLMGVFVFFAWIGTTSALIFSGSAHLITGNFYHRFGTGRISRFRGSVPSEVLERYPNQKVGNTYNAGSFLIWSWWPFKKVLIDSKGSAYTDEFWERIVNEDTDRNLLQENIYFYITETTNRNVLQTLESREGWKPLFGDEGLILYHYVGKKFLKNEKSSQQVFCTPVCFSPGRADHKSFFTDKYS